MIVKITKPCRVNILGGEVDVTEQEYARLKLLGFIDKEVREIPEVQKKTTRKGKK